MVAKAGRWPAIKSDQSDCNDFLALWKSILLAKSHSGDGKRWKRAKTYVWNGDLLGARCNIVCKEFEKKMKYFSLLSPKLDITENLIYSRLCWYCKFWLTDEKIFCNAFLRAEIFLFDLYIRNINVISLILNITVASWSFLYIYIYIRTQTLKEP